MGFYYNSNQPPQDEKPGSFRDVLLITWAVFTVLAKPLGVLLGVLTYFALLFWLFTLNGLLGIAWLALPLAALAWRGIWEWRHPPEIK